jgi:hypothetical protein
MKSKTPTATDKRRFMIFPLKNTLIQYDDLRQA